MNRVQFFTHLTCPFQPTLAIEHPNRQATIEMIKSERASCGEIYCTVALGADKVTKRVNGDDLSKMLESMADSVMTLHSRRVHATKTIELPTHAYSRSQQTRRLNWRD